MGKHVSCISVIGLERWERENQYNNRPGFRDPLGRVDGLLTTEDHYDIFVITDDPVIQTTDESGSYSSQETEEEDVRALQTHNIYFLHLILLTFCCFCVYQQYIVVGLRRH